jgi:predicted nucleic acid-binding protein
VTFLLDTNVISELRKPASRVDQAVRRWAANQQPERMFLSVISVMELEIGIGRVERHDLSQARRLTEWLETRVLQAFSGRMLPIDLAVARRSAILHVPDPRPERDALIAATALVNDLTVVTRNVSDFAPLGVRLQNPWNPE